MAISKKEILERVENLELLVFILLFKNKPIMVNGKDVSLPPPPKQLELFRGTNATI